MLKTSKITLIIGFLLIFISIIFWPKTPVTATINPTETNNNWQIIKGNGVSLSLPKEYMGGDPAYNIDKLTDKLIAINPELANRLQPLKQEDLKSIKLLAINTNIKESNLIDNVNIVYKKNKNNLSLKEYISQQKQILTNIKMSEQVTLKDNLIAEKMIAIFSKDKINLSQLYYIFAQKDNFTIVTYSTNSAQFEELLPIFENSIKTLTINN